MKYLQGCGRFQHIYDTYSSAGDHRRTPHLHLLWLVKELHKLYAENGIDNWYHMSLFLPEVITFKCPHNAPRAVQLFFDAIPTRIQEFYTARLHFIKVGNCNHSFEPNDWRKFLIKHTHFHAAALDDVMDDVLMYVEIMEHQQRYKTTKKVATKSRMVQEAMA